MQLQKNCRLFTRFVNANRYTRNEREISLIETSLQLECTSGATKKGSPTSSKGTFDIPCKLNFRVGPDEKDGDKRPRRREEREGRGRRQNISYSRSTLFLRKGEYRWFSRYKRYQGGRDSTIPFRTAYLCLTSTRIISHALLRTVYMRRKKSYVQISWFTRKCDSPIETNALRLLEFIRRVFVDTWRKFVLVATRFVRVSVAIRSKSLLRPRRWNFYSSHKI